MVIEQEGETCELKGEEITAASNTILTNHNEVQEGFIPSISLLLTLTESCKVELVFNGTIIMLAFQ